MQQYQRRGGARRSEDYDGRNWRNRTSAQTDFRDSERARACRLTEDDWPVVEEAAYTFLEVRYRPFNAGRWERRTPAEIVLDLAPEGTHRERILLHLVVNLANQLDMGGLASRRVDPHKRAERK
jgi:hypothetical protein